MDILSTSLFVVAALIGGFYLGKRFGNIGLLQAWNWIKTKLSRE